MYMYVRTHVHVHIHIHMHTHAKHVFDGMVVAVLELSWSWCSSSVGNCSSFFELCYQQAKTFLQEVHVGWPNHTGCTRGHAESIWVGRHAGPWRRLPHGFCVCRDTLPGEVCVRHACILREIFTFHTICIVLDKGCTNLYIQ